MEDMGATFVVALGLAIIVAIVVLVPAFRRLPKETEHHEEPDTGGPAT